MKPTFEKLFKEYVLTQWVMGRVSARLFIELHKTGFRTHFKFIQGRRSKAEAYELYARYSVLYGKAISRGLLKNATY